MTNYTAGLTDLAARAIALDIARQAMTDRDAAQVRFRAHTSAMSAEETELFERYLLAAAMDIREREGYKG